MESAGADLYVRGEVPLGAGLSSSAAIEVSTAFALTALAGRAVDRRAIALLCQRAEGEFVGMRCGIMDQFIAAHGVAHHAIELDCRSLEYRAVPLPEGVRLVIANTMVKHELASGEYNRRRASCEEAAQALGVKALRDATLPQLETGKGKMNETAYRRARHIIGENARVEAAVDAFGRNRLAEVGDLMAASHRSLRDDYEVSCAELDLMVHLAGGKPGCLGARMTGGGFGGSTVNLVEEQHAEAFRAAVAAEYEARTGVKPAIYICDAVEGASEIA
jgi:galactokinase